MSNQEQPERDRFQGVQERSRTQVTQAQQTVSDITTSVEALRTETDRARSIFGFGRRILVPPDEIHVVVGDGRHILTMGNEGRIFGQVADRPSRYWLNPATKVIKLKTISFTVPIHGHNDQGVEALDNSKVSFRLWAHAVAKLNPEKAEVAAQRIGVNTQSLDQTITQVAIVSLINAAAQLSLDEIIADRQDLASRAEPEVNNTLAELGYDLALLTITRLDGEAYRKLIMQAEARILKETGIATNREQLAELDDDQARERREAEIQAITEKKLAAERLEAQREVETATISQQESLDIRRHEMELKQVSRKKAAAEAEHDADLAKLQLNQQIGEAEAEKAARLARLKAERDAELRAEQHRREAAIRLAQTEAEAARLAVDQAKEIERKAALTQAEAERLRREELAAAERGKEVALLEANQVAEALKVEAEAEARALQIRVDTETQVELVKAEAEATATEKRAQAAKVRAEATRAETAALGLAEAEVEAARVEIAEQRVAVTRAEGLAGAEVAQAQAEAEVDRTRRLAKAEVERTRQLKQVDIDAQTRLAQLYEEAPVLVDLEKMRMQLAHEEKLMSIQAEASLKAFEAIAPGIKVNLFGNGGQTGEILTNLMSMAHGLTVIGDEVPAIGGLLAGNGLSPNGDNPALLNNLRDSLARFTPHLHQVMADVNPRMFSALKVADVVERLSAVVAGDEDLVGALNAMRQDASFRVVGDLPIGPVLELLGLHRDASSDGSDLDAGLTETIEVRQETAVPIE